MCYSARYIRAAGNSMCVWNITSSTALSGE